MLPLRRFTILSLAASSYFVSSLMVPRIFAQEASTKQPTAVQASVLGSINGRVTCADNKQPARLADVFLVPKPAAGAKQDDPGSLPTVQARTQTDGGFSLRDLPTGDYFVIAHLPGYVLPVAFDESTASGTSHADLSKFLANFPTAHITAGGNASIEISLTPGTALAGHVEFENGSPVVGQWIEIQSAEEHDPWHQVPASLADLSLWVHQAITDDEGKYRFAGLPPGKYWLYTIIQPEMDQRKTGSSAFSGLIRQSFTVYAPGVFRKSLAKAVEVKGGEQQIDNNIIVSVGSVHTVRGKVVASGDKHSLNFGSVSLKDPKEEKDFSRSTPLDSDGTFYFDDVPDGSYSLTVTRAADVKPGGNPYSPTVFHSYDDGKAVITLSAQDAIVPDIVLEETKKNGAAK